MAQRMQFPWGYPEADTVHEFRALDWPVMIDPFRVAPRVAAQVPERVPLAAYYAQLGDA